MEPRTHPLPSVSGIETMLLDRSEVRLQKVLTLALGFLLQPSDSNTRRY